MSNELIKVVTPPGKLKYVNIYGKGKENYNKDGYEFVASIDLEGEAAQKVIKLINTTLGEVDEDKLFIKSLGYRELLEDKEGVYCPTKKTSKRDKTAKPTGIFRFAFSTKTTYKEGEAKKIAIYDSSKPKPKKINLGDKKIGNDSIGCISGAAGKWQRNDEVGVSLYLNAIQLVKFIEYEGDAGFEAHEDGYVDSNTSQFEEDTSSDETTENIDEVVEEDPAKPKL